MVKLILRTLAWLLSSALGLACFGVSAAAWFKAHQSTVVQLAQNHFYIAVCIGSLVIGLVATMLSVWLMVLNFKDMRKAALTSRHF